MVEFIIIIFAWYLKALADAILFGKGWESVYELWHFVDWFRFWVVAGYLMYITDMGIKWIVVTILFSFCWNLIYCAFRFYNVYKLDNKYRIRWLGKILGRGGII